MRINLSFMRSGKTVFAMFMIYTLLLPFFFSGNSAFSGQGKGNPQVVAIQGRAKVQGQDAVVEILVVVHPGENAKEKAKGILKRMYPGAEEIDSANFTLTGLFWDVIANGSGNAEVPFEYNNSNEPVEVDGSTVIQAAFETWNEVETSIFKFGFSNFTNKCPSLVEECAGIQHFNGVNEIAWLDIAEPSVLGVTWFGTIIDEFDMALDNADFDWYDGDPGSIPANAIDLQTVWLHEFGHGVGLGHSEVDGAVLEPFYAGPRRDLHQDDIDGITSLYPCSLNCDLIINLDGSIDLAINNNCDEPVLIEWKLWARISGQNFPLVNVGSDGSLTFPAGFSSVIPIIPAGATLPSDLEIGTRFLDPITGQEFCVDTEFIP